MSNFNIVMPTNTHSHIDFVLPILVSIHSPRQNYVFDLIFKQLIGIDYKLYLEKPEGGFLSYGSLQGDFSIFAHSYLSNETVEKPVFEEIEYDGSLYPFGNRKEIFDFPFDLFSTIFYFVSRHEEYYSNDLDEHGRYKAGNSWLVRNGWLQKPIVNYLVDLLRQKIEVVFGISLPLKDNYKAIPTIDIDNGYAFYGREKSMLPSILKSLLAFDFKGAKQKRIASKNKANDPFDTHQKVVTFLSQEGFCSKIFFLMKTGVNNSMTKLVEIKRLIAFYEQQGLIVGVHPSYNCKQEDVLEEKKQIEEVVKKEVKESRFHFIQFTLPKAYQNLLKADLKIDYSMGYASQNGFRAGICNSFYWFDLEKNKETNLKIVPFYFMDATYIFNLKRSPIQAMEEIELLIAEVKKHKGELSFVFHNESLSDEGIYKGWKEVWDKTFALLK